MSRLFSQLSQFVVRVWMMRARRDDGECLLPTNVIAADAGATALDDDENHVDAVVRKRRHRGSTVAPGRPLRA